ncbi:hypothetical protein HNQ59_000281 [Chitinivorax tropicus]|uniref:YeeE/YedE family protein n=1 Tax=Chitinivorax tropicus TaxID=714531 RepID=A0A840MIJ6_9PROT|nr:YeeE/YedE family protein [Chitinivorax tropicus]MBB5017019.1 hypothetical protein [Chitinivorax tropicus]
MLFVLLAALCGLLFGLGLIVAGMANPAKVLAFLDVTGHWDPSLMLVMVGGISLSALGYMVIRKRGRTLLGLPLQLPTAQHIDRKLLFGAALFGIGWGLTGICPGPAVVLLGSGVVDVLWFVLAMLAGMLLHDWWWRRQ